MDGYKHYIRLKENDDIIIHRFSSAFEEPQEGDICVNENGGRHYNDPVTNERGQFDRQWLNGEVPRSQEELDAEWLNRPPEPPTELDIIGQMLVEKDIQIMQIQSDNDVLGQQLVEIDIRMMMGGI